ncbi:hypothetical protein ACH5RR_029073 [Cinchona calisaya]|uniref:Uncharacterized protein n=1 Tax=Cinchona calisaya TaxID=153742 RepID=A0ABD2YV25_9GENT
MGFGGEGKEKGRGKMVWRQEKGMRRSKSREGGGGKEDRRRLDLKNKEREKRKVGGRDREGEIWIVDRKKWKVHAKKRKRLITGGVHRREGQIGVKGGMRNEVDQREDKRWIYDEVAMEVPVANALESVQQ